MPNFVCCGKCSLKDNFLFLSLFNYALSTAYIICGGEEEYNVDVTG
jgi:hypothetical protein